MKTEEMRQVVRNLVLAESEQQRRREAARSGAADATFPAEVIVGAAGKYAKVYSGLIEAPMSFLFMAYLTCLGALVSRKVQLKSEIPVQPRLFTAIVGESGSDRKSTAISKVIQFFKSAIEGSFPVSWGIGSAEGLQLSIREQCQNGTGLLLALDEFKALISKCNIDGSVLLPCINTLFEKNEYQNATKKRMILIEDAHLSMLSASTLDTYERIYSRAFVDIGFPNRIFLVVGSAERKFSIPKKIDPEAKKELVSDLGDVLRTVGDGFEMGYSDEAFEYYDDWYHNLERSVHARRIDTYASRLAILLALNQCKRTIDIESFQHATTLCDWQLAVRKLYDPIDADNKMADLEQRIKRKLLEKGSMRENGKGGLQQSLNYMRYGTKMWKTAINNLSSAGEIVMESDKRWRLHQ